MHRGLYITLGLVAFLAIGLQFTSASYRGRSSYSRGYGKSYGGGNGYGSSYGLEEQIRELEEAVEALQGQTKDNSERLETLGDTVSDLASQECATGEGSLDTPINSIIHVDFNRTFDRPPKVSISLRGITSFIIKRCSLSVKGVSNDGFYVQAVGVGPFANVLYSWIACPAALE